MQSLQELIEMWKDPPSEFRAAPFWSWNSKLDPDRLTRAIESMHAAGMGGFFMHSRYGLKTPYLSKEWFECVSACVAKARELGMKAYLYDEDRWPSGSCGGTVTRDNPEYRMRALLALRRDEPAGQGELLGRFAVTLNESGELVSYDAAEDSEDASGRETMIFEVASYAPSGWCNDGTYVDTMNGEAVNEFIRLTHQAYADRYGKDFGNLIPGIFTDEPNYFHPYHDGRGGGARSPAAPWTPDLPQEFIRRRAYDLRDKLPEIFLPAAGSAFSKVRYDYYRTLSELFVENFTQRIGAWCERQNIALTGHMLGEGSLRYQVSVIGSAMPHYLHMQIPGIDILCDQADELLTAKQCSSVAAQFAKPRVLSELYGCTGWDFPLAGHKFVGDWQLACGVDLRCSHLTHYSLSGGAKRDYPASIFAHSPWWKYYKPVEDYFARMCFMLAQGKPVRDVLVMHPIESAWGLYRHGSEPQDEAMLELDESFRRIIYALTEAHHDYDLADESILAERAKASGKTLTVGQMSYKLVIVPPCYTLRSTSVALLEKLTSAGGKVIFAGRKPDLIDAEPSEEIGELIAKGQTCGPDPHELIAALDAAIPRQLSVTADGRESALVWSMLRSVENGRVLFVQSHDREGPRGVHVSVAGSAPVILWDAMTGKRIRIPSLARDGRVEFDLDLGPGGSALLSLGIKVPDAEEPAPKGEVVETRTLDGPWEIELTEPNTLPLDYPRFAVGDEDFSEPLPTLAADTRIRERFGLSNRIGYQHQPWYLYATGAVDVSPRGSCRLLHSFHVTKRPKNCSLGIERPEDFRITVNGKSVNKVSGWWVDEDIKTIDITRGLREGENEILLTFDYRPDMELEDLYLIGEFGVAKIDRARPPQPGNVTLVAAAKELRGGSWVGQGLDFYGGSVRYRLRVERPGDGSRVRISLPDVACTAVVIHAGEASFILPWGPFSADVTDALEGGTNEVIVELIGGRKNILGPLHTSWERWTGPAQFDPSNEKWQREYLLTDHGLMAAPLLEILK